MKTYFIHFSIQTRRKFKNQPRVPSLPSVKYVTIVQKISEANPFLIAMLVYVPLLNPNVVCYISTANKIFLILAS